MIGSEIPSTLVPGLGQSSISTERALNQIHELLTLLWEETPEENQSRSDRILASLDDVATMKSCISR